MRIAHTLSTPLKDVAYHWSRFFVGFNAVSVLFTLAIAICGPSSDKFAILLLCPQSRSSLSGNILAVDIIHYVFQRNDVAVAGPFCGQRVERVIDRDKANIEKRKYPHQVVSRFQVVPAKAGEVLDYNTVNLTPAHILHQTFKTGSFKVCSGPPVIAIQATETQIRLVVYVSAYQFLLRFNRVCTGFPTVLNREAGIASSFVNTLFYNRRHRRWLNGIVLASRPCHLKPPPFLEADHSPLQAIPSASDIHCANGR